tara:strand:+ start:59 stop:532 length:474 start_codon:yes stop_codon:yes gene_type:complete
MECVVNERRIKYNDGEVYWWYCHGSRGLLKNPRWRKFKQSNKDGYKHITINNKHFGVHRVVYKVYNPKWNINDTSKKNEIDHIDLNRSNNNIENLRVVTGQENMFNRKFKGYSWDKSSNKYQVQIIVNGKKIWGGRFKTEEEAIKKRAELKIKYHTI